MSLEPRPDCHTFVEDPLRVVERNLYGIYSWVLDEVQVGMNVPLLNSCQDQPERALDQLKWKLSLVVPIAE